MPGKLKSEVYCASPVTLRGPSMRCVSRPSGEGVVAMISTPEGSACRGRAKSVSQTTLRQFDLEAVLALRLRALQRSFGSESEGRVVCRLPGKRGFGFRRAPRF